QLRFFQDFARFFPEGGTASIATNYRSAAAIVGAGNRVMADRGRSAIASQRGRAEIAVRPIDKCFVEFRAGADHERSRTRDAAYFVGTPFASCEPQSKGPSIPQQQVARALKLCAEFIVASTWRESGRLRLGKLLILARTSYAYGLELSEFDKRLRRLLEHHDELAELSNEIELEVITAHKAKGNEADSVIVLDVTSRKFPLVHADNVLYHPFGVTMEDTLAEERRLFYVAITRAEWRLLLLTETGQESPYLVELQLGQGLDALECLAARDGSARASTQSLSELGVGIHSRIEELDRWDLVVGNASASAVPILERLRAQKYPPPQVGHFIQRESRKIFAEFAWPDELPPMAILTGPHAAYANDWRDLGWQIVLDQPRR
ncbi:MAG: 3'-5' exonuclease, partial [Dokdonella sp.]